MQMLKPHGRLFGQLNVIDLTIACCLLSPIPVWYYGYRSLTEPWKLTIQSVEPHRFIAGQDKLLVITGTGFDTDSIVYIATLPPQKAFFYNGAHLAVEVPPEVGPGWQVFRVRNGRGRLVTKQDAFHVVWQPTITSVRQGLRLKDHRTVLEVYGYYLASGSAVVLDDVPMANVQFIDSTHLHVVLPRDHRDGKMVLRVIEPYEKRKASTTVVVQPPLEPPVEIDNHSVEGTLLPLKAGAGAQSPPLEKEAASPKRPPSFIPVHGDASVVAVVCAFPKLSWQQLVRIDQNAVQVEDGTIVARVINVIGRPVPVTVSSHGHGSIQWTSEDSMRLTHLVLMTERVEDARGVTYRYDGRLVRLGSVLNLRFSDTTVRAAILSEPVPVKPSALTR